MAVSHPLKKGVRLLRRALHRRGFDSRQFWNTPDTEHPDQGCGPGSEGGNRNLKHDVVRATVETYKVKSVLDIGCGDLATLGTLAIDRYVGLDISNVMVERNRQLRPEWEFACEDLAGAYRPPSAELALCFDVLIHQKTQQAYLTILSKVLAAAERVALISGYSHPKNGWTVFFHEPIGESIKRLCPHARISQVAEYRATDLFRIVK